HHEKWDGSGYPKQIAGEAIPLVGRIAAVADVFDALTAERPYKKAWSVDEALALFEEQKGKHFDPRIVELLFENLPKILAIKERFKDE
ncbi:HD domain-containing phosphohydrolase, partial [Vibrio sp. 10N.261.52.A1]|uniref:HD-GYP domain-containing protein n=2 Tax=Vibrionaceae TaxID=641 RepID=UPI0024114424